MQERLCIAEALGEVHKILGNKALKEKLIKILSIGIDEDDKEQKVVPEASGNDVFVKLYKMQNSLPLALQQEFEDFVDELYDTFMGKRF